MKPKKYSFIVIVPVAILLLGLLVYFRPLALSELAKEGQTILITRVGIGVKDGVAYTDSENYNDLTAEQTGKILDLFVQYSYRRTVGTLFSDGSIQGTGDRLIYIFLYDGSTLDHTVILSGTGRISVDEKTYRLKDSDGFEDALESILAE